ncbi:hypothetical protein GCM10023223_52340 [Stackebrandtia albiflava]
MIRSYAEHGDACRAANALDLVGDRWTLIIVRELLLGPKRFADLAETVRGITPAVLTGRLRHLEDAGIVTHRALPDPARTRVYAVTEWGRGLETILRDLGRWYTDGPDPATTGGMTPDAVIIAMRTMAPSGLTTLPTVALHLHDDRRPSPPVSRYHTTVSDGRFTVCAGEPADAAATVATDSTLWSRVLFAGEPLDAHERHGSVAVTGDHAAVTALVAAFA